MRVRTAKGKPAFGETGGFKEKNHRRFVQRPSISGKGDCSLLGKYTLKNLEVKLAFNGNVPCSITGTGLIGPAFRETGGGVVRSRRRFAFRGKGCGS